MGQRTMKDGLTLQEQAEVLMERAEEKGVANNFFFRTTFKRYQVQMSILADLERAIAQEGATMMKQYGTGRQNLVANPAITEYNKTSTAANGTVSTLISIMKSLEEEAGGSRLQALMEDIDG